MTSTMYLSGSALARLQTAQEALDAHPIDRYGRCLGCGRTDGYCPVRDKAHQAFAAADVLPRRRPGLSHPERRDRWLWFGGAR